MTQIFLLKPSPPPTPRVPQIKRRRVPKPSRSTTYRHHSPRRNARSKNPPPISPIRPNHKIHHIRNRITRPATPMRKRHLASHIPAVVPRVGGLRVNHHEPVRLGVPRPLAALVVGLGAAAAPVDPYHDGWFRGEVLRNVEPHASPCGVVAVVGHLGEGCARYGLCGRGEGGQEGQGPEAEEG